MKQVGYILLACLVVACAAVMFNQTVAADRKDTRGIEAHKADSAARFRTITSAHPVTRPADVGGDVEWFNQLVREGKATSPSTRDTIER